MAIDIDFAPLLHRRTKIIATVGPASDSRKTLGELIDAGVNIFRLNMSHGDHQSHTQAVHLIREVAEEKNQHIGILADLCGPKIRCGTFADGQIELVAGEEVVVTTREVIGGPGLIPSAYRQLHQDVERNTRLLLDDGKLELMVEQITGEDLSCRVLQGGVLKSRKGINMPYSEVSAPPLTDKDIDDARLVLKLGVEFIGLSFTRKASDVELLRELVAEAFQPTAIIAKLENHEALQNAEEIIAAADGIMIARGDMGVELRPEEVPVAQNQLVKAARRHYKPVIVATQMLESMLDQTQPTRAEVSDISHAVQSGADAIMLSGETAAGKYPVEAVKMMDRIARHNESYLWHTDRFRNLQDSSASPPLPLHHAVANALTSLSNDLQVHCIIVMSMGGTSAAVVSSGRPSAPIVAASPNPYTCRKMTLNWGIVPIVADTDAIEEYHDLAGNLARQVFGAHRGDRLLLLEGFHFDPKRHAPAITVLTV